MGLLAEEYQTFRARVFYRVTRALESKPVVNFLKQTKRYCYLEIHLVKTPTVVIVDAFMSLRQQLTCQLP